MSQPQHPLAWLAWLALAFSAALTTRNPLYLMLILLALVVVYQTTPTRTQTSGAWSSFIRLGIFFGVIGVGFDTLTAHIGDTVLFWLPADWPIIGGRITLEAVIHGLTGVIQLACLLVAGAVFSQTLDAALLLRFVPPAFYHSGLVLTIGLAFIPQTVLAFQEIRDAQRIRGHQFRAARDWLPLVGPLLTTGLERAVQLAESMEARGLGYSAASGQGARGNIQAGWPTQLGLLLGGLGLSFALFGLGYWGRAWWNLALGLVGAGILLWTLRRLMPGSQRTRYRRVVWGRADQLLATLSLLGLLGLMGILLTRPLDLFYTPYPRLTWPSFEVWLGVAYLLLLLPMLVQGSKQHDRV